MEKIVNVFVSAMIDYRVIDEGKKGIMIYGLDLLFSSIASLLSFVLLGIILNVEMQSICFFALFIPLQSFGGGYHCQTHFRCWLLMLVCYLISIYAIKCFPVPLLWESALLVSYSFIKLAPIENVKAPFSEVFRKKMHITVLSIYFIALVFSFFAYYHNLILTRTILAAVILSGVSILAAKIKG